MSLGRALGLQPTSSERLLSVTQVCGADGITRQLTVRFPTGQVWRRPDEGRLSVLCSGGRDSNYDQVGSVPKMTGHKCLTGSQHFSLHGGGLQVDTQGFGSFTSLLDGHLLMPSAPPPPPRKQYTVGEEIIGF